jgi:hypothetical protein
MAAAHPLTDHDEIRDWAEARKAKPTCVKGTGRKGDTGMIRLGFPGFSGGERLQPISWDQWFRSFDENNLALIVQDTTPGGKVSNFNKLVARNTAAGQQKSRRSASAGSRNRTAVAAEAARSKRKTAGRTSGAATKNTAKTNTAKKSTAKKTATTAKKTAKKTARKK